VCCTECRSSYYVLFTVSIRRHLLLFLLTCIKFKKQTLKRLYYPLVFGYKVEVLILVIEMVGSLSTCRRKG